MAQAKTTSRDLRGKYLAISTKRRDIDRLLQLPGPTYIFGIHEPTKRVFVRSVHVGVTTVSRIPVAYELTSPNLQKLHAEVRDYWTTTAHKPITSEFA